MLFENLLIHFVSFSYNNEKRQNLNLESFDWNIMMLTRTLQQIFTFIEIQAIDPLFNPTKTKSSLISKLSTSLSKEVLCSDMFSYLMKITQEKMSFKLFAFATESNKKID